MHRYCVGRWFVLEHRATVYETFDHPRVSCCASGECFRMGLSPLMTGHLEPWDADGLYYVGALTVTGIVTGGLLPRPLWAHYLGSVVGQLTYELIFLKLGPLFFLGIVFLLGYSVVFLVAAAITARVRVYFTRSTF